MATQTWYAANEQVETLCQEFFTIHDKPIEFLTAKYHLIYARLNDLHLVYESNPLQGHSLATFTVSVRNYILLCETFVFMSETLISRIEFEDFLSKLELLRIIEVFQVFYFSFCEFEYLVSIFSFFFTWNRGIGQFQRLISHVLCLFLHINYIFRLIYYK